MTMEARKEKARRGLAIYFGLVVLVSGVLEGLMIRSRKPIDQLTLHVVLLMWTPTFASIVARLVNREGIRDVSFRFGGRRGLGWIAIAAGLPLVVGGIAYGIGWATNLAPFQAPAMKGIASVERLSPAARTAILLLITSTVGVPLSAITATGEEIGWRGYMLTRLVDAGVPRPVFVSGAVWGLWHVPLILSGQYAAGPYPGLSAILFLAEILAASYVAARSRFVSGSVWPAIVFHAAWNSNIQGFFDGVTKGGSATRSASIWIGESGILVAAVSAGVMLLLSRGAWTMRRSPKDEPEPIGAP